MNNKFMQQIVEIAKHVKNEIPVAALICKDNEILSITTNQKETNQNPLHHAEILAINEVAKKIGNWRLEDCDLYVTLEPCPMCASAIIQARIKNVYFGSYDNLYGALGSKIDLRKIFNSNLQVKGGLFEQECNEILEKYFENIRKSKI